MFTTIDAFTGADVEPGVLTINETYDPNQPLSEDYPEDRPLDEAEVAEIMREFTAHTLD